MQFLRANTAVDVLIGPFVEDSDGDTPVTGSTLDVELSKNGQALANKNDATAPVHDGAGTVDGYYNCELDATDTNTEGTLTLVVHHADSLPIRHDYMVLCEAAWDSMFVAKDDGYMDVNIKAVSEDTTAAINLESACDNYSATRGLSGTALPAAVADAAGGLVISDSGALDIDEIFDAIITDATGANIAVDIIAVKAETVSILADTDDIGAAGAGLSAVPWNAAWDAEVQSECNDALVAYDPPTKAEMDTGHGLLATEAKQDVIDGVVDTILVDTADMQPRVVAIEVDTGTTLQGELDGIQADTEDIQTQIGTAGAGLTDLGGMSVGMKGEVNAEADTAISDYDPPTKAEMDTGHGLLATEAKQDTIDGVVDTILVDTADMQPRVVAIEVDTGTTLDGKIDTIDTVVDGIQTDLSNATDGLGALKTLIDALNDVSAADINAQVLDVLNVDTFNEPGDEELAVDTTLVDKLGYLYKFLRNKIETTSTRIHVYNAAEDNKDQSAIISDDDTTFTRGEFGAGD